jgi:hypothetical protein
LRLALIGILMIRGAGYQGSALGGVEVWFLLPGIRHDCGVCDALRQDVFAAHAPDDAVAD